MSALVFSGVQDLAMSERRSQIALVNMHVSRLARLDMLPPILPAQDVAVVQVADETGRVVSSTREMAGRPLIASFAPAQEQGEAHERVCSIPAFPGTCMSVVVTRFYRATGDWLIYGADPVVPWYVNLGLVALLLGGSLLLVAITALGTSRVVGRALAPVDNVCTELAEITASDLSRRVPLPLHRDEIRTLAETVNQTLDRLQQAVERQRRFASDAGHDLRSPITAMRAQMEDALRHPEDTDWIKTSESVVLSLDRLQAIVADLLVIARLDSGQKLSRDYINLAELVRSEAGRRFRGKRIVLGLRHGVVVGGDRLQLVRLLTNLLDNAERHALSTVTILVSQEDRLAALEVLDDGEGIPPEQREVVFQRFTRLPSGREKDSQGTGLGLAIARDIAEQHEGTLTVEDSPKGARFVLRIPLLTVWDSMETEE
ncbi:sensor histidine kinase [Sphaerisporangium corydalis]|uniref:histidine kinase n=1 Tax=Sphaerisporangium corydalis TaxID=1441875 RepID=A0ABV9EBD6_9ACTN|nr:HAMP domain-containing sensor histidine kinase [Sphaerisporangium corydalis]